MVALQETHQFLDDQQQDWVPPSPNLNMVHHFNQDYQPSHSLHNRHSQKPQPKTSISQLRCDCKIKDEYLNDDRIMEYWSVDITTPTSISCFSQDTEIFNFNESEDCGFFDAMSLSLYQESVSQFQNELSAYDTFKCNQSKLDQQRRQDEQEESILNSSTCWFPSLDMISFFSIQQQHDLDHPKLMNFTRCRNHTTFIANIESESMKTSFYDF